MLSLFTKLLLLASPAVMAESLYGYQLHSWNDMRQWPAAAARARVAPPSFVRIKIDPHYVDNAAFCARHGFSSRDCLVFSHDSPDTSRTYNTSLQLAAGLQLFPNGFVALCGKYVGDVCANAGLLKLFDDMMSGVESAAMRANVTLIMDGVLTPGVGRHCMRGRYHWKSTYINTQDPRGAATSNEGYYDDFQVLNMPCCAGNVEAMARLSPPFGKFASNYPQYPFQLYEPSDQADILSVASAFNASKRGEQHLLYAINQDPMQLGNYLAASPVADTDRATKIAVGSSGTPSLFLSERGGYYAGCPHFPASTFLLFEACGGRVAGYAPGRLVIVDAASPECRQVASHNITAVVSLQCASPSFVFVTAAGEVGSASSSSVEVVSYIPVSSPINSAFTLLPARNITVASEGRSVYGYVQGGRYYLGVGTGVRGMVYGGRFLFVTTDSYCFNCESHNKRAHPLVCDQKPVSTPNVMSYTVGAVEDLLREVRASGASHPLMHSCNAVALHNWFGAGQNPSPVFREGATVGIAYSPIAAASQCPAECGCPEPVPGDSAPYQLFTVPLR